MAEPVVSHRSEWEEWETFERRPAPELRPYVRRYTGWVDRANYPSRRREVPQDSPVLIVNLFDELRVSQPRDPGNLGSYRAFFAGLTDSHVFTETDGSGGGIQVDLTPLGGRLFLGRPMSETSHAVFELEDLLGADGREFAGRLLSARTWDARLDLLDTLLLGRMARAAPVSEGIAWAWNTLTRAHGRIRVGALADELGWSQRHFIRCFRDDIGLPPKQFARVLRFQSAVARLRESRPPRLVDLAIDCGYYDQPHFVRDFRQLAGCTPTEFRASFARETSGIVAPAR